MTAHDNNYIVLQLQYVGQLDTVHIISTLHVTFPPESNIKNVTYVAVMMF